MTRCAWRLVQPRLLCVLLLPVVVACSPATPPPSGTVACTFTVAGVPECYGYTSLNPDEVDNAKIICGAQPGVAFVDACPVSGLVGCCHESMAGVTLSDCYYGVPDDAGGPSALQMKCMQMSGTWSVMP
jgi:hypothetical protein